MGLFGHVYSHLSFLFSVSLSLGDGPIQTEVLSQRAVKPKITNQPNLTCCKTKKLNETQKNFREKVNKRAAPAIDSYGMSNLFEFLRHPWQILIVTCQDMNVYFRLIIPGTFDFFYKKTYCNYFRSNYKIPCM